MSKLKQLQDEALAAAKTAREIAEKADGESRSMTDAERGDYAAAMAKGRDLLERIKVAKVDERILEDARQLSRDVGPLNGDAPAIGTTRGDDRKAWAKATAAVMSKTLHNVDGQKALVSGTIGTSNIIDPNVTGIARVPTSILDLVTMRSATSDGTGGNAYNFLRQTVRTNNAAPVVDAALKPTSVYTMVEIEDRFRVLAHLSEAIPQRFFADDKNLQDFLASEMSYGLELKLEQQMVSGAGTGENMTGITATSGVVAVAFATDILTTIRKALTGQQAVGNQVNGLAMNPTDLETVDLVKDSSARYLGDGPFAAGPLTLWGVPVVPSVAITAGTALLGDWSMVEVIVREGATVAVDVSGDQFVHNTVIMRVEGRFGVAVKRPSAFSLLDLTA